MELEKRVELLEQELQILKNQIQNTLLGIQEQLLTNAYPSLRAEETTARSQAAPAAPVQIPASPAAKPAAQEDEDDGLPKVRRVSLRDLDAQPDQPAPYADDDYDEYKAYDEAPPVVRAKQPAPAAGKPAPKGGRTPLRKAEPESRPASAPAHKDKADTFETLSRMDAWVCNKIEHLGAQRTRSLIYTYAGQGRFNGPTTKALLQLVDAYETENPAPSTHDREPAPRPAAARPTRQPDAEPVRQHNAEPDPALFDSMDGEGDAPRSMVLRLIAGVGNAGAGVFRRNGNG